MSEMMEHPAWIMWEEALSEEIVNEIIEAAKEAEPQAASTFRTGEGKEDSHRKTQIRWLQDEKYKTTFYEGGGFGVESPGDVDDESEPQFDTTKHKKKFEIYPHSNHSFFENKSPRIQKN